uniref:Uncharacterized protein n=1 Tax=Arundo donax TaxID=35708 RepID=A0A0A9EIV2_ARUDO
MCLFLAENDLVLYDFLLFSLEGSQKIPMGYNEFGGVDKVYRRIICNLTDMPAEMFVGDQLPV